MLRRKSNPLSIRLDEGDLATLGARADDLGVSVGKLVRNLVRSNLHSEVEVQLEGIRAEVGSMQNQLALLQADLDQLNENLRDVLKALLCPQTGDEDLAREMADEVVKPLRGDEQ